MATIQSVRYCKQRYEDHVSRHVCRMGDGCESRLQLWALYQREAEIWGGYKLEADVIDTRGLM